MRPIKSLMFVCVLILTAGLVVSPAVAQPKLADEPAIISISPASFASGVNQPVTISGTDLSNVTVALLGETALRNLHVTSASEVTALVPWSIPAGTYDLTVKSQGGPEAILPGAVTVAEANNDWVSNGPFGGDLFDVVLDPVDPSLVYVSADMSGVWRSQDSGANWHLGLVSNFAFRTQISYPTPGQPPVIYASQNASSANGGLDRSLDYGQTWELKVPPAFNSWQGRMSSRVFVRPDQPNWVYLALSSSNENDPDVGLYVSPDQGESWSHLDGTAGLHTTALAFDPDDPDHIILGTIDGNIYTSSDNGDTWSLPLKVNAYIGRIMFAPNLYNGKRSLWVTAGDMGRYNSGINDNQDENVYRSNDGGLNWIIVADQGSNGITYHETIPGLLWSASRNGYYSTDNGDNWTAINPGLSRVQGFAVVPGSTSRETTTLFAATYTGLYKSTNGGDTWAESDQGLGAELARTIAISPFNADEAYAATQAKGLIHTFDGGRSWQDLPIPISGSGAAIAPDPFKDGKVYVGNSANSGLPPTVRVSGDHGGSFNEYSLPLPPELAGRDGDVLAIAPDPQIQNRLLAGVCLGTGGGDVPPEAGLIYASTDGGVTWTQQATPAGTTCIDLLSIDQQDPNKVYAGSTGSGLLRSTDRGATWAILANQPNTASTQSLAIDPRDSNSIYLDTFDGNGEGGEVFATHDGGDTWVKLVGNIGFIATLKLVKVGDGYWLYAANTGGLIFLRTIPEDDPTARWEAASGIAGVATVQGLNAATEDGRVVYYISTSGGVIPTPSGSTGVATATGSQNLPGGIYRSMVPANQIDIPPAPGWQRRGQSGTGITALEVFNGQLYAGRSNWAEGDGARVWRLNPDNHWAPVSDVGMSATYGSTNPAVTDLVTFKGYLYASVGWGSNEGQIWRSPNGTDWSKVTGNELGGSTSRTVTVLTVFDDILYAGAGGDAEIWRSSSGDSGSWERVAQDGLGNPNNGGMSGAVTFDGALYVSLMNGVDGTSVWQTTNGTNWTQVNTNGFGDAANSDNGGMAVLGGYLYAATLNNTTGGQIWRYDGINWSQVVGDGFGDINNSRIESLYSVNKRLFAVTQNTVTGSQAWMTVNGTDWTPLNLNGFGNIYNNDMLWSNSSTAFENSFFVGNWNGEIWQYVGFPVYLPMITR